MAIHYEGFYIPGELPSTLDRDIKEKHITTEYKPEKRHEHLYGLTAMFEVVGYGNDGKNEGYKVALRKIFADEAQEAELREIFEQIPVPHITLSVAEGAKPVNTRYLEFSPIESKTIIGFFKGFE